MKKRVKTSQRLWLLQICNSIQIEYGEPLLQSCAMQSYTEISPSELSRYTPALRGTLETVCESASFRASPKSCEFLRHIVNNTLNGTTDELKERLIGITLLGRETTYDTGSDAGVRVRANDVRKRLTAYSKANPLADFLFVLPSGSYVPRFYRQPAASLADGTGTRVERLEIDLPLTLQQLAAPTIVALFLCVICLRWQIGQEHPFITFWQHVFQGHNVRLYLEPVQNDKGSQLVAMREIQATVPLLNLAGQFHSQLNLTDDDAINDGEVLISIGEPSNKNSEIKPPSMNHLTGARLTVVDTANGREIFDRTTLKAYPDQGISAALLTISGGSVRSINIDGTDDASINSLVRLLCERDNFPESLADSMTDGTSQIVFPMTPGSQPIVFHDPLSVSQLNVGKVQ
jgi:hypothetical protein